MKEENQEMEMLKEILDDISELIAETRASRSELKQLERQSREEFAHKKTTSFTYDIRLEKLRRAYQEVDYCLRSLEHQRKLTMETINRLRELD